MSAVFASPVSATAFTTASAAVPATPTRATPRRGLLDTVLTELNRAMSVLTGHAVASRAYPAEAVTEGSADTEPLTEQERRHAAGLMRVNHVGEVCAQALYRGQAVQCQDNATRALLYRAAQEETDHLAWCEARLRELDSRPSLLNPLWYAGSFGLGLLAGRAGVPRNLGFMAETERQVEEHLENHLTTLPASDARSRAVVTQMRDDEIGHRVSAEEAGAQPLPAPVKLAMRLMSRVMTMTAYRV